MSIMIDEQPKYSYYEASQLNFLKSLIDKLRSLFKDTFAINPSFLSKNTCQIAMTSAYKQIFKIYLQIVIQLQQTKYQFSHIFHIRFTVDYPHLQKIKIPQQLGKKIRQLKAQSNETLALQFNQNNLHQIHLFERKEFKETKNTEQYANMIKGKIKYCKSVCDKMDQLYKNLPQIPDQKIPQMYSQKSSQIKTHSMNDSTKEMIKSFRDLILVQKQPHDFQQYFQQESKRHGFLKNPDFIQKSPNQVTRNISIESDKHLIQWTDKLNGSYSRIFYVQGKGQKHCTLFQNRKGESKMQSNPYPSQDQVSLRVIQKVMGGKYQQAAYNSFQNEVKFLIENGDYRCPFINNYYFEVRKSENDIIAAGPQDKIFSDYHQMNVYQKFSRQKPKNFTMSDIINFAYQILIALKDFYLYVGFLHRDIKPLNILISEDGVIKIIDHGSVFPHRDEQEMNNAKREKLRSQYHSELHSSIYVDSNEFKKHRHDILKDYKSYKEYNAQASTHKTFDVYSVGIMLKEMLEDYSYQSSHQRIEVDHQWEYLISKMTELVPSERIQVMEALEQIKKISSLI